MIEPPDHPLDDPCELAERIGRRRFIQGVGAVAGAGVIGAGAVGATLPADLAHAAPAGASRYVSLPKGVRVADTRPEYRSQYTFNRLAPDRIRVPVAGEYGVPSTASALVLTLAAVNREIANWVVAFPSAGDVPLAANLNLRPLEVNANLVTVKLSDDGKIDVKSRVPCDVIVDVLGYYEPVEGLTRAGRFIGLTNARRAIDTRPSYTPSNGFTTVDVTDLGIPPDAAAVVANITATETTQSSYFTAVPMEVNKKPTTSSLNVRGADQTRGAAVIVPISDVDGRRQFKVYSLHAAKLVVDIFGYMTGEDSSASDVGLFVPVTPTRILDTRDPGQIGKLWPRWVVEAKVPGAAGKGQAIACNVTGVDSRGPGYFQVSGARRPRPVTANVNWSYPGAVVPNHVITPVTAGYGIQIYSSHGAHAVVDMAGYFTGSPKQASQPAYINPPPPAAAPPWVLRIPKIGLTSQVLDGHPIVVTDSGHSWRWAGTGYMGQDAHVATFAHRTEAGAPYRHLDQLVNGDEFTITTGDGRIYTYRVVRRDLTDAQNANILNATRLHPGTTFSMIACTVGYDSRKSRYPDIWAPTSLLYRIIVTGELVSWFNP